ncbi:transposase [Dyella solisilvae]|uniref:Transposase n=1 Tax=Dyella solisilvae TaxID=1920168 RepID=A0A370KCQ6_9GAMM|nr:transposase [Dyella solisilvae]
MKTPKFAPDSRGREVRMVLEHQTVCPSQWAAILSIAPKMGRMPRDVLSLTRPAQKKKFGDTLAPRGPVAIKKTNFTEEQMVVALKHAEGGRSVEKISRKMGVSQAAFYAWREKFAGLGVSDLRGRRQLEEESRKLKQLVVALSLDKAMLQGVLDTSRTNIFMA